MSTSVARQVATSGAAILIGVLVVVGVGTGIVLHTSAVGALDAALLEAALGRAHPEVAAKVEVEHVKSPIEAWLAAPGDSHVPAEVRRRALAQKGPLFIDQQRGKHDERMVLLAFELEHAHDEPRGLAVATAPRVTFARSVGAFALVYPLIALLAAALALVVQVRSVRRAFRPLDRARAEAAKVLDVADGTRLTEAGPVEVRGLVAAMNALIERLTASHQAQVRFTAEAAHELRTPVTAMLGELDVTLREPRAADEYRQTLTSIREDVARLRHLVEGLTALARIDTGQVDQGRERVRAAELATGALAREAGTLAAAGCSSRLEIEADPELVGHRVLLEVALCNLLRNAARHAPRAEVVMRVTRRGEHAVFAIDDAGPGIAPDVREGLFGRFTRGGDARRRDRTGLGLGLPIAREVARRHVGDCVLEDSPLGGLRATLSVRVFVEGATRDLRDI